ncbi:MAG: sigma-70 family RNA polymerase sigma factor [Chitinophagaceae bacterium]|nr:sigma-70 family RNA polymerase sigma factor [Chitinophagaceae bacterium]MBK8786915.1 sigma-70 family RNA polymerase sigma factor [Chitinophagaceae bacterium]MBK9486676.1 sigma-70 family RNA polymerase sigma factor [Chitinophagaceae bacterium]
MMQNNKDEFLKQIDEHKLIIYKICNSYCKNRNDRDDLVQEIIYQLWRSYNHFNGTVKFSTWMYRVALNVAITFYRKTKTSEAIIQLGEPDIDFEDSKEDRSELEENKNLLQQFINELKELDKALMILYLEEKSYNEISEILGITETNVATRISRIKDKLKQKFSTLNNKDHG